MQLLLIAKGFVLGLSMILPIGAQNAYVLNQGIKQNHHLTAASICMICDFLLIVAGVYGGGRMFGENPLLLTGITWAGIAFLTFYGYLSCKSAFAETSDKQAVERQNFTLKAVIVTTLAVTLLNPHVYLDTLVILGSIGSQLVEAEKRDFVIGCMLASLVWFYSLAFAAAKLSPVLSRKKTKQIIDVFIAGIMWLIAFNLYWNWQSS